VGQKDDVLNATNKPVDELLANTDALKNNLEKEKIHAIEQIEKFMEILKEAIITLSLGDLAKAREKVETLSYLASSELFKGVGEVAKGLHNSIKEIQETVEPILARFSEDGDVKITSRLSRVSSIVKESSDKTLDLLFTRQEAAAADKEAYAEIAKFIDEGNKDDAKAKLAEVKEHNDQLIDDLMKINELQIHSDLVDQLVKKIIGVIGDVEDKLLGIVRRYARNVRDQAGSEKPRENVLHGPIAEKRPGVASSQDEVDNLLDTLGL